MMDVTAGFAEPVLAAQATFRVVMDVMARPGTIRLLAGISAPAPLSASAAAIALTLLDYETPFWLDPPLAALPASPLRHQRLDGPLARASIAVDGHKKLRVARMLRLIDNDAPVVTYKPNHLV